MNFKLIWHIFWGKCYFCKSKISASDLNRSIQPRHGFLFCPKCRGEITVDGYTFELLELQESHIQELEREMVMFAKGSKSIAKRLNKLISKYNLLAKRNRLPSIQHFDFSLRLKSEGNMEASIHESKYLKTNNIIFETDKMYPEKIEKEIIKLGKLSWNITKAQKAFNALLKEYNKLADKYNRISKDEKIEKLSFDYFRSIFYKK